MTIRVDRHEEGIEKTDAFVAEELRIFILLGGGNRGY
jgi:hypothetical protein